MKKNLLVTLADKNYVQQAKALFSSVYWNAGWKGDYMLLSHEIPEKELKWFKDKGILVKKCKPLANKNIGASKHPPVVLDKFYLFTPYFKKWNKIVYLDADIIVRAPLNKLTKVKGFAAPEATGLNLNMEFKKNNAKLYQELKNNLKLNKKALHAGIFCFNTSIIKGGTFKNILKIFYKYEEISRYAEELALNLFFYEKWKKLSIIYNTYPFYIKTPAQYKKFSPIIIHFVCKTKPWEKDSLFNKEWVNYLEKAEQIDFNKSLEHKEWNKLKILRKSIYINSIVKKDQYEGRIGALLKRISPRLYKLIKNIY